MFTNLAKMPEELPISLISFQVDFRSEFIKEFEAFLALQHTIPLFILPFK
jgi:hypothetical protein